MKTGKMKYIVNGEERTARAFQIFKLTVCIYRKCKRADKRVRIDRDKFFGTGTTMLIFLPF